MEHITEIRPKFRHNAVFIQTENGLFVTGEGASFQIKGKSIARWISVLRRSMNGQYTLDQLCSRLAPEQREHVARIVTQLLERGIVKNSQPEAPETLPRAVMQRFRDQIDYIDHFVNFPLEHFKHFRESSLLLYGSGESLKALALFLIRNGIQHLSLATADAPDDYSAALEAEIIAIRQAGCDIALTLFPECSLATLDALADYETVIYCSDNSSLKEIALLNQRCVEAKRTFLSATLFAGHVLLGPLVQPATGPCWFCALMRFSANSDERTQAHLWQTLLFGDMTTPQETLASLPLARRIGYGLGFELFKIRSGCLPSETEHGVIFQNLENLESARSELVQHPCCPVCSQASPQTAIQQLETIINQSRDYSGSDLALYEQHQHLFDQRLGLFTHYADDDVEQLPLKRSRIIGGKPEPISGKTLDVTAFSIETPFAARLQALKKAINAYMQQLPPKERLVFASARKLTEMGETVIAPQHISTWSGTRSLQPHTHSAWLPAFSLSRKKLVYVPAAAVYSSSSLNSQHMFQPTAAGTAVDSTFEKVLTQGTLSALGNEYLRAALHTRSIVQAINLATLDVTDADLRFLVQSAQRFARAFAITQVIVDAPLTVIIAHTTDPLKPAIRTLGLATVGIDALKAALLDLISVFQMDDAPDTQQITTDAELLGNVLTWNAPAQTNQASFSLTNSNMLQLQNFLHTAGRDILFVDITSADIWAEHTFIGAKILLTRPTTNVA